MKRYLLLSIIGLLVISLNYLSKSKSDTKETTSNVLNFSEQFDPEEKSCTDASCHGDFMEKEVVHMAVEDGCENCHKSTGEDHPKKNTKGFTLNDEIPQLCFTCHDENNTKKHIHPPVEEGECMTCHTPHSADKYYLLKSYPSSTLCFKCHDHDMIKKPVLHRPVKDGKCYKCHDPHESDRSKFLKKSSPNLCFKCHKKKKKLLEGKSIHPPFEDDCMNCHKPHSSEESSLLPTTPLELCYSCHDDVKATVDKAVFLHKPVNDGKGCINCHSPHGTNQGKLIRTNDRDLCLFCHDKVIVGEEKEIKNIKEMIDKSKMIHGAIEMDGCIVCHKPHTSNNPFLLVSKFPEGRYAKAEAASFELCFDCHESGLFESEVTEFATAFRNGKKNLHTVHINGVKGRNCNNCHNVHASTNTHLISDIVYFGNWEMPIGYIENEKGGSCRPGCHDEREYKR